MQSNESASQPKDSKASSTRKRKASIFGAIKEVSEKDRENEKKPLSIADRLKAAQEEEEKKKLSVLRIRELLREDCYHEMMKPYFSAG